MESAVYIDTSTAPYRALIIMTNHSYLTKQAMIELNGIWWHHKSSQVQSDWAVYSCDVLLLRSTSAVKLPLLCLTSVDDHDDDDTTTRRMIGSKWHLIKL